MTEIESAEQYKQLIKQAKSSWKKTDTNCFLIGAAINKYIEENSLYYSSYDNLIIFCIDEGRYYNAYYYKNRDSVFPSIKIDKPLLIEEIDAAEKRRAYIEQTQEQLFAVGFKKVARNLHFEYNCENKQREISDLMSDYISDLNANGYNLYWSADDTVQQQIVDLWRQNLKPTDVPESHFSFGDSDKTGIITIRDTENNVCCVNRYSIENNQGESRHTVTAAQYRGKGFAGILIYAALYIFMQNKINKATTWIDENNTASIKLHEKIGFKASGKTGTQYLLS